MDSNTLIQLLRGNMKKKFVIIFYLLIFVLTLGCCVNIIINYEYKNDIWKEISKTDFDEIILSTGKEVKNISYNNPEYDIFWNYFQFMINSLHEETGNYQRGESSEAIDISFFKDKKLLFQYLIGYSEKKFTIRFQIRFEKKGDLHKFFQFSNSDADYFFDWLYKLLNS